MPTQWGKISKWFMFMFSMLPDPMGYDWHVVHVYVFNAALPGIMLSTPDPADGSTSMRRRGSNGSTSMRRRGGRGA